MEKKRSEELDPRDKAFMSYLRAFQDSYNAKRAHTEEQKEQGRAFAAEKPLYKEMLADAILMQAELRGTINMFGFIAHECMDLGIDREFITKQMVDDLNGYWDETEKRRKSR